MTSRLLIDEPPLLVLRSLAKVFGLNEAIVLQQMHYRQTSERNKNHFDGRVWVRNTYEEWGQEFPFWGKNTIVRTIEKLNEQKLILTHMEQTGFRNLKSYSIDYEMLNELAGLMLSSTAIQAPLYMNANEASENSEIDLPKMGRSTYQNDKTAKISHETYTYKEQRGAPASEVFVGGNQTLYREQPTPAEVSGLGVGKNGQMARVNSGVQSADYEISGSPTTQDGVIDLPILGRPSTQNGYTELPNLGKSYTEAENKFNNINLPPLTPPSLKSAHEEEDDLPLKMIQVWNRLVQEKIKDSPRKELVLTDGRRRALEIIFNGILDGDFAEWERYCSRIAGIRFLLGENESGFKVNLEWALNVSNALKVLEGQIYDKPGVKEVKVEKAAGEFNQVIEDLFKARNYPADWLEVYRGFARLKGQACFDAWLKPCVPLAIKDGQAVLIAPTRFHRDHMSANYLCELKLIARECWKNEADIKIEVKA
ncbi:MAG: hypothetical protein KBB83_02740 [Alphaproteobacteria bacterium]|nr:hypothetical protein [Alphaproteobacteria bacterium]